MAFNPSGAVGVPLTCLGGLVTEMSPAALPEGVSPDNAEMMYQPGSAYSRSAFQKFLESQFPAGGPNGFVPTVVYGKGFVAATGVTYNLYFDSNGVMWTENVTSSPRTYTKLFQSTPGSFCKSITAFGREYIAISDGLHGADFAYRWDGTYLDRVTQDGPGAPPTVTNLVYPAVQMASGGNTLSRNANTVTANTAAPHNLQVGYQAQISNIPDTNSTTVNQINNSSYQYLANGNWQLASGAYRSTFNPGTSSLGDIVFESFGFNIPSAATILGVVVSMNMQSQATTTGTLSGIALWEGGAQLGTAKTPGTAFTTTTTANSYGSAGDAWGASLTPLIVNNPSFGFSIAATCDSIRVFVGPPFMVTVYYTLSGSGTVAFISSIYINNESQPGLALVTTDEPHGLIPGIDVSIVGVEPAAVASVSGAQWVNGVTTLTTAASHNLNPGSVIQIQGVTTATSGTTFSFDITTTVEKVPAPNQLVFYQTPITATDPDVVNATADTGTITVAWPIPDDTPTPTYFEVQSVPTPTTFYVQVTYSDGTWTSGTVGFIWEGTFFVTNVISPTEFQYYQPGPNGSTSAIGTVTPYGQMAPGLHLLQQLFLLRDGTITRPSPPATFIANGGSYPQVANLAIGPSNVVARIVAFTGAQPNVPGELPPFFYIASTPQLEGQIVGTPTQINDNSTTTVVLDFSDNTLFGTASEGGAISVTGNNLVEQVILDGALGFGYWQSRLTTCGQRNTIQNLLSLHFGGGVGMIALGRTRYPLGWTFPSNSTGGAVIDGVSGQWAVTAYASDVGGSSGLLQQSGYLDAYGAPIFDGNTLYTIRCYLTAPNYSAGASATSFSTVFFLTSVSTSLNLQATILGTSFSSWQAANGGWFEATFSAPTPSAIPSDLQFGFYFLTTIGVVSVQIGEISVIDAQNPYLDNECLTSYTNNPSGFDGVTGVGQPTEDTRKIMDFLLIRSTPYAVTQDPSGRLHEIGVNPTTEPSGWTWREVAANCGTLSAFAVTHSQADDVTAAGGEDWGAWPSEGGAMVFDGAEPRKVSQEIQPNWFSPYSQYPWITIGSQINMSAALTISALNDPVERMLYFFVPVGTVPVGGGFSGPATAPSKIYPLSYRELNGAAAIANSPPFHPSLGGKLIATDNTRKWTIWNRPMNGAARMYVAPGQLTAVFFGGNGQKPGIAPGYGNVYQLNASLQTDDDYGQIAPYYTTYFFLDGEKAQALQLAFVRLLVAYLNAYILGTGKVTYTFLVNSLTNPWNLTTSRTLSASPNFDQEIGGAQCQGNRIAVKISSAPITGTDNGFNLQRLTLWLKKAKLQIRGAAQ